MEKLYLTLHEVAEMLGVAYMSVYRWTKTDDEGRKLPAYHIGRDLKVKITDLEEFIQSRAVR